MTPLCLALPGNDDVAARLAARLGGGLGRVIVRRFPDGESYVRIEEDIAGREVILVCTLDRPDPKTVPLLLAAATVRDLGAARVGLVAPYLAYLRQDRRFAAGEAVSSVHFARLLGASIDWLVTVDPHLHRYRSLAEIYAIPALAVHAAPLVAAWIRSNVPDPIVVGPDAESAQWAAAVARDAGAPHVVLQKTRRGDRDVGVSAPGMDPSERRTPVLVDDIISTGQTVIAAVACISRLGTPPPVVIGIHAVLAEHAHDRILAAGAARVVTTNTIPHPSNAIDVGDLLAGGVRTATWRR